MARRGRKRSDDGPDTRTRLIDATARVVVEQGLRAMTVEQVLAAAGLSRRTFYQHFRSKEDATLALYESVVADLVERVRAAVLGAEEPVRRLFAGIDAYLDFQQEGGDLITLLQAEAANPASMLSPARERTLDALVGLMDAEVRGALGVALDPLVFRSLYLGMEALVIHVRDQGPFLAEDRKRVSRVMKPLFVQTLAGAADMPKSDGG